jgi:hypothetical protein
MKHFLNCRALCTLKGALDYLPKLKWRGPCKKERLGLRYTWRDGHVGTQEDGICKPGREAWGETKPSPKPDLGPPASRTLR